jgi:hypothetical protein
MAVGSKGLNKTNWHVGDHHADAVREGSRYAREVLGRLVFKRALQTH